jgi:diacylglycerol kinase (ATP)
MRVTVLHNPSAGDEDHSEAAIQSLIERAGHEVAYQSLDDADWEQALTAPADLIAIAGGDGAVRKVLRRLESTPPAVTLLPVGSANNIARSLGFADLDFDQLVERWAHGRRMPYSLGELRSADERQVFVESAGAGLFAEALSRAKAEEAEGSDKVELGIRILRELVEELPAQPWRLTLDGVDHSGEFIAVEAAAIGLTGPNVPLVPDADPSDELLDVVMVTDRERTPLASYLEGRLRGEDPPAPALPARRAADVSLSPPARRPFRVDDDLLSSTPRRIDASVGGRSVEFLLPY